MVDDPEGLSSSYAVRSREHGTAIASLIVHGDLGEDAPSLPTPLYVRPVMQAYELFDGSHGFFSQDDRFLHRQFFPDEFYVAMVLDPNGDYVFFQWRDGRIVLCPGIGILPDEGVAG